MTARAYTTREVADMVGRTPDALLRAVRRLHEQHGMPLPLAGRPYTWDRVAFDAWRTRRALLTAQPANDQVATEADVEAWRAALAAEYGKRP